MDENTEKDSEGTAFKPFITTMPNPREGDWNKKALFHPFVKTLHPTCHLNL